MSLNLSFIRRKSNKQRIWRVLNLVIGLATVYNLSLAWVWAVPTAHAAAGANIDQCANGTLASPDNPCLWINGNLNASKSHYAEGESVAYRTVLTGLTLGTHELVIGYDITHSSKHALDYLTQYQRIAESVQPCTGVSPCAAGTAGDIPIPSEATTATSFTNLETAEGNQQISIWNGDITNVAYLTEGNVAASQSETTAKITFTATDSIVVLGWGGHIASQLDWGAGNSATGISGSPYHMRLHELDGASTGQQDRSLKASAVLQGSITVTKVVDSGKADPEDWTFTISPDPVGTGPLSPASGQDTVVFPDLPIGTYTVTESSNPGYHQVSSTCTDLTISGASNATLNQSCEFHNAQNLGNVTFEKIVVGGDAQPTDWTFTIDNVAGSFTHGDSVDLAPGQYTVTETGPGGYTATSVGGICGDLKGTTATLDVTTTGGTCTFTNTRHTGDLLVLKNVDTDGDGNIDILNATNWTWDVQNGPQNTATGTGQSLPTGNYTISEDQQAGFHVTDLTCDGQSLGAVESTQVNLTEKGLTCTFTNTRDTGDLTVIKQVENDNGGDAVASNFTMHIQQSNADVVTPFAGSESGSTYNLPSGTYVVSESALPAGYSQVSIMCDGQLTDTVTVTTGGDHTCTITNTDDAPQITLIKNVINDNGGNAGVNDFGLTIGGQAVTSGQTLEVDANTPIALDEVGLAGYNFVEITGHANCPQVLGGTATLDEGETITCTIHNDDVAPQITLIKNVINDNGGNAGVNDFGLTIGGQVVNSGDQQSVDANTPIALDEAGLSGYAFVEITGHAKCPAVLGGTVTLDEGEHVTCTIHNDDIAPQITLIKNVINNNGGTAGVNDFGLTIGGQAVTSGQTLEVDANTPVALNEAGLAGYNFVEITGHAKCPQVLGGTVTLDEGEHVTCTITNDDVQPGLTVYKFVDNNDGGTAIPSDFTLRVNGINVSPDAFNGDSNGTLVALDAGSYDVTEDAFPGYTPSFSQDCSGTLGVGEHRVCVVTNADDTPHLIVFKHVINDNGGTSLPGDFTMHVNGTDVSNPNFPGNPGGTDVTLDVGAYSVTESGPSGYAASFSPDCTGTIELGGTKTCTITNDDIAPELTVIKHVVNDNGGNQVASQFTMHVAGTNVSNPSFPGNEVGTTVTLDVGAYSVSETQPGGYIESYSSDCAGTIAIGEHKTCTVTNNDIAPQITLIKNVINDNGGTAGVNDFGLTIGGQAVTSGQTKNVDANTPIPLNEAGLSGYTFVEITGDKKCPDVLGGTATLDEGETITCTITNDDIAPELTVIKHVINDNGGNNVAGDFTMEVSGTNVSNPSFPGDETGTTVTLDQGSYSADEQSFSGYDKLLSDECSGVILVGETKTCTITNNDQVPSLTLIKNIENNNGGTEPATAWTLTATGPTSISGTTGVTSDASFKAGTYALSESGPAGYDASLWSCTGGSSNGSDVTIGLGEDVTCEITNDDKQADLTLDKTADADTVQAGGIITYTLAWSVENGGFVSDAVISDTIPTNTSYVLNSATCGTTGPTCTIDDTTNTITWSLGDRQSGDGGNVTFQVDVASPLRAGTEIDNQACIDASLPDEEGRTQPICDPTTTIVESAPILSIEKTNDVASFTNPGNEVTYTLVVTNDATANDSAYNVVVNDTLPGGFSYIAGSASIAPASVVGQVITWNAGDLAPSDSFTVTYDVTISAAQVAGTYTNTATAEADNHDPVTDPSNVEVRVPVVLGSEPEIDLSIVKVVDPTVTNPGKVVTYTLTVANTGDKDATNVVVTDTLPAGFTFVEGGGSTKTFVIGTLKSNRQRVINYEVQIGNDVLGGFYQNTAVLTADGSDPLVAQAEVEVRVPQVLGLATTGAGLQDYLIFSVGLSALGFAIFMINRLREEDDELVA